MALINKLTQTFLETHDPQGTIWVAYSGGVDSHVLLHVLATLSAQYHIKAVHINHGLYPNAEQWSAHCQSVCDDLNIACEIVKVDVKKSAGESLEAQARHARYSAFESFIKENDVLVTAHHQGDQAETLLLQLLRGAGIKGLSGMPETKTFGEGCLLRPLLNATRADILEYAKENKLNWIEDESNRDEKFSRNFLRHQLLPVLEKHWPQAKKTIARSSKHIAEANSLLDEIAASDLANLKSEQANILSIKALLSLSETRQRNVLRYWFQNQDVILPDEKKLQAIIDEVMLAQPDTDPCVNWKDVEVRRFQDGLYLLPKLPDHDITWKKTWDLKTDLTLPSGLGKLTAKKTNTPGLKPTINSVDVRFRQGGEQMALPNRQGHHTLKNLFQEWQVPTWQRDRIPLLYVDNELTVVVGYAVAEKFIAPEGFEIVSSPH